MVYITKIDVFFVISRLEKYMLAGQEYRAIYLFSSSSGFVVSPGPIIWLDYINWFHVEQTMTLVSYSVFNFIPFLFLIQPSFFLLGTSN